MTVELHMPALRLVQAPSGRVHWSLDIHASGRAQALVPYLQLLGPVEGRGCHLFTAEEFAVALDCSAEQSPQVEAPEELRALWTRAWRLRARVWLHWGPSPLGQLDVAQDVGWLHASELAVCRCGTCGWLGRAGDRLVTTIPPAPLDDDGKRYVCPTCSSLSPKLDHGRELRDSRVAGLRVYWLQGQLYRDCPDTLDVVPVTSEVVHDAWAADCAWVGPSPHRYMPRPPPGQGL